MSIGKIVYRLNFWNIRFGRMAILSLWMVKKKDRPCCFVLWRGSQGPEGHLFSKSVKILESGNQLLK